MGRHYSTRDFFRQMPNAMLGRYFEARGVLAEVDFAALKEARSETLFHAWLKLPESHRKTMDAELREIHALSCEKGWSAIRDEAQWQMRDRPELFVEFVEKLSSLPGHEERAMIAFLEHPELWKGATLFCHADTLSYWRKRKGFPHQPASIAQAVSCILRFGLTDGCVSECHGASKAAFREDTPRNTPRSIWLPSYRDGRKKTQIPSVYWGFFRFLGCSGMSWEGLLAEREGFEPPIAFRLWLISSQLHSTGLCHLSVVVTRPTLLLYHPGFCPAKPATVLLGPGWQAGWWWTGPAPERLAEQPGSGAAGSKSV